MNRDVLRETYHRMSPDERQIYRWLGRARAVVGAVFAVCLLALAITRPPVATHLEASKANPTDMSSGSVKLGTDRLGSLH